MNSPFVDEYWQAAYTELETLEGMVDWGAAYCDDNMKFYQIEMVFWVKSIVWWTHQNIQS